MNKESTMPDFNRRQLISGGIIAGAATFAGGRITEAGCLAPSETRKANRRMKQSIVHWCFGSRGEKWSVEKTCQVATRLGYDSVELVSPQHFPTLKKHKLTCAILGVPINPGPAFMRGFNNLAFHEMVIHATKQSIDAAADNGFKNVIAFTGFSAKDPGDPNSEHLTLEEGAANCVNGFKQVIGHAEKRGVNICLEMLNSRDASDPMKGHPGYQGDHTDYCIKIIEAVGSRNMKLLFDIYHVQVMDGDVIRRIRQYKQHIGHVHTAGNPGRGELDQDQEINYPAVMRALLDVGYDGHVGQEFIPTRDPVAGLRQAFEACDV